MNTLSDLLDTIDAASSWGESPYTEGIEVQQLERFLRLSPMGLTSEDSSDTLPLMSSLEDLSF